MQVHVVSCVDFLKIFAVTGTKGIFGPIRELYASLKRNVLSLVLNISTVTEFLILSGIEFQSVVAT